MKAVKTEIPNTSLTNNYLPADYTDAFICSVESTKEIEPDDVIVGFWTNSPSWITALFKLRNFLVQFVGLKGDDERDLGKLEACIRKGEAYGIASVHSKNKNETVLLLTDKHLEAYMSVHIEKKENLQKISSITLVHFKNKLGTIYFFFIKPFQNIIVKSMLKRSIKHQIEK